MRQPVSLTIPQPCHQSWAAMTPTTAGRHCAACEKTVVDFTLKTDAEILAFLAGAVSGRTCGRFAAGQLERPLQRAVLAAPTRWRAWLAAAVAVWGLREGSSAAAHAQAAPAEWRARYWGGPVPVTSAAKAVETPAASDLQPLEMQKLSVATVRSETMHRSITMGMVCSQVTKSTVVWPMAPPLVLRGVITDATNGQGLSGVTVLLKGTQIGTSTGADGHFELYLPELKTGSRIIVISSVGYLSQERPVTEQEIEWMVSVKMNTQVLGGLVYVRPWPWHLRSFYSWSKYWLTKPFRGY